MRAVEKFYSVGETAGLLAVCTRTVRDWIKAGELGRDVANLGSAVRPDYRIPASAINAFLAKRRVFAESEPGLAARSVGELRRKARAVDAVTV